MADKTIAQLAGLLGGAVSPEDLLPIWDVSENVTKSVSIAALSPASLTKGDSTVVLADAGGDAMAELTIDGKNLLKIGTRYALSALFNVTQMSSTTTTLNNVAFYNPLGGVHLRAARSDTAASGTAGNASVEGGYAADGSNKTGGMSTLIAGVGNGTGAGGLAQVSGGMGGANGAGGAVALFGGTGGLNNAGGAITLTGGRGGYDSVNATFNNGTGNGGGVAVTGGVGGAVGGNGGSVAMTAGNGTAAGSTGGLASLTAGEGVAVGGSVYLKAGGGATPGQFYWQIGDETVARVYRSAPGSYVIDVPAPSSATSTGHLLSLQAGYGGTTAGSGGTLYLNGGPALTDGHGGAVVIQGRDAAGTDKNGGDVTLTAGNRTGSGTPGNIVLTPGSSGAVRATGGVTLNANANANPATPLASPVGWFSHTGADAVRTGMMLTGYDAGGAVYGVRSDGTGAAPAATSSGKSLLLLVGGGYDGTAWQSNQASVELRTAEAWDATHRGTAVQLRTTLAGQTTLATRWQVDGGGHFVPDADTVYGLGTAALRVATLYGANVDLAGGLTFADNTTLSSAVAQRHVANFNATSDWGEASGGYHTLTVTAATHGRGTTPLVQLAERVGGDHELVLGDQLSVRANGDVVLRTPDTPDGRFAGRLIIL